MACTLGAVTIAAFVVVGLINTSALRPFEQDGKWGYRDPSGKIVIQPRFRHAEKFGDHDIACAKDDKGFVWIDAKGHIVARAHPFENGCDYFIEGMSRIIEGDKDGFIDTRGKIVIPPRFRFVTPFHSGRAAFCVDCKLVFDGENTAVEGGRWGFIDKAGREIVPAIYDQVVEYKNGQAEVKQGGVWSKINLTGKPIH
jgi:hypothetical protein